MDVGRPASQSVHHSGPDRQISSHVVHWPQRMDPNHLGDPSEKNFWMDGHEVW